MKDIKLSVVNAKNNSIKKTLRKWVNKAMEDPDVWQSGVDWYEEAQKFVEFVSKQYKIDSYIVACVLAILSPNNKWDRNKVDCIALIHAYIQGGAIAAMLVKVCTYSANKIKAIKVLDGMIELSTKSPKTHSFAMNVGLNSPEHITIDKWHIRACICSPKDGIVDVVESCTAAQYRRIEALTSEIAKEYHLKGYQVQAIIWVMIKKTWKR
tara:strand:+ start:211 stop:840 length:630 start_codon:yes stop_codon:yes gene_type:complete